MSKDWTQDELQAASQIMKASGNMSYRRAASLCISFIAILSSSHSWKSSMSTVPIAKASFSADTILFLRKKCKSSEIG